MVAKMKLSLVIPAYNEERRIGKTIVSYHDYFSRHIPDFEFIFVIEGTDDTLNIVKACAEKDARIRYIYSGKRLGKGGAIIEGFKIATGDLVGFVDADGSTLPMAFHDIVKAVEAGQDCAIASRKVKGARLIKKEPLLQRIGSRGFNALVRTLFLLPVKDTQCGAKILSRKALNAVLPELGITEFAFDIDLLFRIHKKGFKIKEIPTVWESKAGGQFNFGKRFIKLIPDMFLSLVRLRLIYSPLRKIVTAYDKLHELMR
ncbi:MAG TPA: glycosyltransferase [Nanoarchaeota archaeon]|nr:glycosyltransferase [Nanoarchaeota archaeon]